VVGAADDEQLHVGTDLDGSVGRGDDIDREACGQASGDRLRDRPGVAEHGLEDHQGAGHGSR
jgi:hypothetical protein